jgi:hypothetical protein
MVPLASQGQPGPSGATAAVRQAGPHARQRALGGQEGQVCWPMDGAFFRARDLGINVFGSLLLLTDNYILQLRAKPQRHEGTKDAQRYSWRPSRLTILASYRQQRRAAAESRFCAARVPAGACGCRLWSGPLGLVAMSSERDGLLDNSMY